MPLEKDQKVWIYRTMYLSRRFEERLNELFAEGKIAGWIHSGIGHEATGAALALILKETDYLVPYHRSRVSLLGRGLSPKHLLAEIMGRTTGCCRGVGGEAHIMDVKTRIYGTGGVVGSNIPIAVGIAYACKLEGKGQVVACGFGEGGSSRGAFHEALNMAALWDLPIVFICENNQYAEFTPQHEQMKIDHVAERAAAYGMPGEIVDGYDPVACFDVLQTAIHRAREGGGPTLIEAKTYRLRGHYEGDPMRYRSQEEMAQWMERDPVTTFRQRLLDEGTLNPEQLAVIHEEVHAIIEEAVEFALSSPFPDADAVLRNVYA